MTKVEYIKTKAELEALHYALYTLKNLTEDEYDNFAAGHHSEWSKHYTHTKADIFQAAYNNCYSTFRKSRETMIRAIAEYEIEHPFETI